MDLSELKDILRILEKQDVTEFELEQDGVKLRICRSIGTTAPPTVSFHPSGPSPLRDVMPYIVGTLRLYVFEGKTGDLLWEGTASGIVPNTNSATLRPMPTPRPIFRKVVREPVSRAVPATQ